MAISPYIAEGSPDRGAGVMRSYYAGQENQRQNAYVQQQIASSQAAQEYNALNAETNAAELQARQQRDQQTAIAQQWAGVLGIGEETRFKAQVAKMQLGDPDTAWANRDQIKAHIAAVLDPTSIGGAGPTKTPSDIAEWDRFNAMSATDQARYLNMKRAGKTYDVGGVTHLLGPDNTTRPLSTIEQVASNKEATAEATAGGKGVGERRQLVIDAGLDAANGIPTVKRAIDLLNEVETGGYDAVALKAKQLFGIESANEAELNSAMAEAVLGDLRRTFGAQFTASEGERLTSIRSNFGKSSAANARLLTQALKIAEGAANRAIKRAKAAGDFETANEITELMNMRLDGSPASAPVELDDAAYEAMKKAHGL